MIRPLAIALSLAPFLAPAALHAQDWALGGMDPVSYGADGAAIPGRNDIVTMWRGKTWHFVSEQNRAQFEANPRAYTPALGGYCVIALSEGRSEPGNPRFFAIVGKKTYFLRSEAARARFIADPAPFIQLANTSWARLHR